PASRTSRRILSRRSLPAVILVDTNVVVEVMRAAPAPASLGRFNTQSSASLFLTAITVGKIRYGLRIMPKGQSPPGHRAMAPDQIIATAFAGRNPAFEERAAARYVRCWPKILGSLG